MIVCFSRSTSESATRNATESVSPVSRLHVLEITHSKSGHHHFAPQPSDFLCPSGHFHEFIWNACAESCQHIATPIFKLVFCPRECVVCKRLPTEDAQHDSAVSVPEANAEAVDTGNSLQYSEYQEVKNGKYRE
jgi:hypothetical protein